MYYVLFHYATGLKKRGFAECTSEADVINLLHETHKEIDVHRIIEVKAEYRLGLIVTEDYIKSTLELKADEEKPEEEEPTLEAAMKKVAEKKALKIPDEAILEPGEETEKELTPKERTKATMDEADRLIEREKKRKEQKKKGWKLCSKCNSNRLAPRNKTGICTPCQQSSEGKRPYKKRKT